MFPIRVALIGLSSSAKVSWAAQAHLPYLLSERGRTYYEIVALLNSSVKRAEQARSDFGLPVTVKAYGSPEELAQDSDVDLVVCNTRVDTHFKLSMPSVKAGKYVFVEWPLAHSFEKAQELLQDLRADASIVGLQARVAPYISKVKELIREGRIGQILSSDVRAFGNGARRDSFSQGLSYFAQRSVGGNPTNIAFGHMIDFVHDTLGEFSWFNTKMQIQRPELALINENGDTVDKIISDVPDLINLSGPLVTNELQGESNWLANDATLSVSYRNGPSFPDSPGFLWTINGARGEIRVTAPGPYLQSDPYDYGVIIEIHDFASENVHKIDWDWEERQKDLPRRSRNVAELYERFAVWVSNKDKGGRKSTDLPDGQRWPQFEDAVTRHRQIKLMFDSWDASRA